MHRERTRDFWASVAAVVALFVPIWGILLQSTGLIRLPAYLVALGLPALGVLLAVLAYSARCNRVLLNRFLVGYAGGLAGTLAITLFQVAASALVPGPGAHRIGGWLLGSVHGGAVPPLAVAARLGYHFLLDGAAWGAAYALVFGKVPWWTGLLFGFFIWSVLVLSPAFTHWGFAGAGRGPTLLVMLLVGHFLYGGIVGAVVQRWVFPEVGMEGMKAVRPLYA